MVIHPYPAPIAKHETYRLWNHVRHWATRDHCDENTPSRRPSLPQASSSRRNREESLPRRNLTSPSNKRGVAPRSPDEWINLWAFSDYSGVARGAATVPRRRPAAQQELSGERALQSQARSYSIKRKPVPAYCEEDFQSEARSASGIHSACNWLAAEKQMREKPLPKPALERSISQNEINAQEFLENCGWTAAEINNIKLQPRPVRKRSVKQH